MEAVKIDKIKDYYSFRTLNNYCDNAYTCPKCGGVSIRLGHDYCPSCGIKLEWADEA